MSVFQFITLILLSGQVSAGTPINNQQGWDGWVRNGDGTLNYVIKLTPQLADELARNGEQAKFDIPPHILAAMSSISIEVGNSPAVRIPDEETLKADYNRARVSPSLTTLNGASTDSGLRQIDRDKNAESRIQPVAQSGPSAFSNIPPLATSNPALTSTAQPYANTTQPYASSGSSNPALSGNPSQMPVFNSNNSMVGPPRPNDLQPLTSANNTYGVPQTSAQFSDPPSLQNGGNNFANSSPLSNQYGSPSTLTNNRLNDGFNAMGPSNYHRTNEQPSSGYSYAQNNGGYQTGPSTGGGVRPNAYPGNNALPYPGRSTLVSTPTQYAGEYGGPDAHLSSNAGAFQGNNASDQDVADLVQEVQRLKRELNSKRAVSLGSASELDEDTALTIKSLREFQVKAKESGNQLILFQLISIVLLVACFFLVGTLVNLYQAHKNLRATSRHNLHLGA